MDNQPLIDLICVVRPRSDAQAMACVMAAVLMARDRDLEIQIRAEGQPAPEGFFTYPYGDPYNIGCFFKKGKQCWGWRWSIHKQELEDWSI